MVCHTRSMVNQTPTGSVRLEAAGQLGERSRSPVWKNRHLGNLLSMQSHCKCPQEFSVKTGLLAHQVHLHMFQLCQLPTARVTFGR